MLQTSSQSHHPFVYLKCPALAFSGSHSGNWATYLVGYIKIIPSFPGTQSLCSCSVACPSYLLITAYGIPRNETKRNEMKIKKILHKQKGTMALRIIPGLSSKTVLARWRQIILLDKVNTAL